MMELQRLPIVRMDDEVLARDGKQTFEIINPKDVPEDVHDGIFQLDRKNGTAKFESRKAPTPYETVVWVPHDAVTRSTSQKLPDGTQTYRLCDGEVIINIKEDDAGRIIGYAQGDRLPRKVLRFILVQALAGVDVTTLENVEAIEAIIKERSKRE